MNQDDRAKVESYIENQDLLPQALEEMILAAAEEYQKSGKGGVTPQGPSRETYAK